MAGRFFTEGLRTDSLCVGSYTLDGSCTNGLRVAQLVSLGTLVICAVVLAWRHRPGTGQLDHASPATEKLSRACANDPGQDVDAALRLR